MSRWKEIAKRPSFWAVIGFFVLLGVVTYVYSEPQQVAKTEPESMVYITKTGTKYHNDWCEYLGKSKMEISLLDALVSGYEPCTVCLAPGWHQYKEK